MNFRIIYEIIVKVFNNIKLNEKRKLFVDGESRNYFQYTRVNRVAAKPDRKNFVNRFLFDSVGCNY